MTMLRSRVACIVVADDVVLHVVGALCDQYCCHCCFGEQVFGTAPDLFGAMPVLSALSLVIDLKHNLLLPRPGMDVQKAQTRFGTA
jgi:hypothetical protein